MGCINVREGLAMVSFFQLDNCGKPLLTDALLRTNLVAEVGWEDQIDEGDQITERNFGGKKYYSDSGADELEYISVNLTLGGMIPALDTMLMNSSPIVGDPGDVIGFGRRDLSATNAVAMEVLIEIDAGDDCSGDLPVFGLLFPKITNWRPAGGSTLDGSNLVKPGYQGKCYKSTTLQTLNTTAPSTDDHMPEELIHWEDVYDPNDWYTATVFSTNPATSLDPTDASNEDTLCALQDATLQASP